MADRITITFGAETREVEVAGRKMSDVLKDTEDALEDVGASGEDSLDKVTKSADEATESTDKLGSGVGGELSDAFGKFDGTANGALESVADGLGGLAALIPGVGGLIGAGVGAALTEGVHAFTADLDAQAKESEDRIKSMYDNFVESGLNYLTQTQALAAAQDIYADPEKLKEATARAEELGVKVSDVVLAEVQGGEKRNELLRIAQDLRVKELEAGLHNQEIDSGRVVALYKIQEYLRSLTDEQNTATAAAEGFRDAAEQITGHQKLTNEELQKTNKFIAEMPKQTAVTLVPDTSALDAALSRPRRQQVDLYDQYGRALK